MFVGHLPAGIARYGVKKPNITRIFIMLLVNNNVREEQISEIDKMCTFPITGIIFLIFRNVPIYMEGFANETCAS